jgi:uncharacterized RDD family membrane protein YckC
MSQVLRTGVEPLVMDPHEIGWYIESADEDTYGPVSRQTLRRFLQDGTITPNTLIRHCTQPEASPAAEQPAIMDQLQLEGKRSGLGDKLSDAWPRKKRDQLALAQGSLPCAWHKGHAVLVCVRCHAPYCNSCRAKPFRKQFFLCRRCQGGIYNRRAVAIILDFALFFYIPIFALAFAMTLTGAGHINEPLLYAVQAVGLCLFFVRDSMLHGSGPGKRALGLRVVKTTDGHTPLSHGQGALRWLSQFIPFFNLVDLSVPYRDPLLRRFGDRWAGTRVLDTEPKLARLRGKRALSLIRKGVQPAQTVDMTMEDLARLA